jgi:formylmethanofuran dehydrogenase subunit E
MYIPDNFDQWARHEAEQEFELSKRPVCVDCGEPIQDEEAYYINNEWICEDCMECYRREVLPE